LNSISDGAQLKELTLKCNDNENELLQISVSMNNQLDHLNKKIITQLETADDNILVKLVIGYFINELIIFISIQLISVY